MNENKIRKVLIALEESVDKEESKQKKLREAKKPLKESDLLHTAMNVWEEMSAVSHEWEVTPGELLRMCAAVLFGTAAYKISLKPNIKALIAKGRDKFHKLLAASKIIAGAKSSKDAMGQIQQHLGLNLQPALKLAEAVRKEKAAIKEAEAKKKTAAKVNPSVDSKKKVK
jgi:hypothetical protein